MRLNISAFFATLIAIPVTQVALDTRLDQDRFYALARVLSSHDFAVAQHSRSKELDYLFGRKMQRREKTG